MIDDYETYAMLEGHPQLDIAIRTPVFNVHILHFAVALLSEKAIETIKVSLTTAGATSIGHALLHIACLPYREEEIAWCSKIQESIHETRNLNDSRFRRATPQSISFDPNGKKKITPSDDMPDRASRDIVDELHRQEAIRKRVIDASGVDLIASVDCHKNTALHYLAGSWYLNQSLIAWLRSSTLGEFTWQNHANLWGHTPKDLMEENLAARSDPATRAGSGFTVSRGMKQRAVLRGRG